MWLSQNAPRDRIARDVADVRKSDDVGDVLGATLGGDGDGFVNFDKNKGRQLTELEGVATMRTFDIEPDGSRIVFDRLHPNSDVVLIDLDGDTR